MGAFIQRENGTQARIAEQVGYFAGRLPRVAVYSYFEHPTHPWTPDAQARFRAAFPGVDLHLESRGKALKALTKLRNAALTVWPALGTRLLAWRSRKLTPVYAALFESPSPPVLLVNSIDSVTLLNGVPAEGLLIDTIDVKFINFMKKTGRRISDLRVLGKLRSEAAALDIAAGLVAITTKEAELFQLIAPRPVVFYVPGFSRALPAAAAAKPGEEAYDLLFVGNDNHFNITGLLAFLDQEKDFLEGRRLAVAGRVCFDDRVRAATEGRPNVSLLGFVDDLAETYGASKLAISPVEGTGLKIKAVEALAHGKPVFGSPHTLAGLPPGYEDCVFLFDREAMAAMLDDPAQVEKAGAAARHYSKKLAEAGDLDRFGAFVEACVARR